MPCSRLAEGGQAAAAALSSAVARVVRRKKRRQPAQHGVNIGRRRSGGAAGA